MADIPKYTTELQLSRSRHLRIEISLFGRKPVSCLRAAYLFLKGILYSCNEIMALYGRHEGHDKNSRNDRNSI
jgi:hypothetical protein